MLIMIKDKMIKLTLKTNKKMTRVYNDLKY